MMDPQAGASALVPDDRFAEIRESVSVHWRDGAVLSVHAGFRQGCGIRKGRRDGSVAFTSKDSLEPKDLAIPDGWGPRPPSHDRRGVPSTGVVSDGDEGPFPAAVEGAIAYLDAVRQGTVAGPGGAISLEAEVQLTSQKIGWQGGDRRVSDVRKGIWVDVKAIFPNGGISRCRRAASDLEGLEAKEPGTDLGRRVGCRVPDGRHGVRASGCLPVVFASGGCEALLHEIGHLFEADAAGESPALWRSGDRIAPEGVTIVEDPHRRRGRGSYRYDDEGRPASRVVLVGEGRASDRIHNGRRASYRDLPLSRMACTYLEAGEDDPRAIVSDTRKGILVTRLGTGSVDPESGRVTMSVTEGFLIESGRVTSPLAPSFLLGDVMSMLDSIDAVGSDLTFDDGATNCVKADQQLPVIVGLPTIRIGMIKVISP